MLGLISATAWAQQAADPGSADTSTNTLAPVVVRGKAEQAPGSTTVISGEQLEDSGDMKDIVRYQPLVSAPGTAAGTSRNRSSFDRSGTTGYNIRGIEGNRIGLDVDGVEMPDATARPYVSRAGVNTFGVGRDFIDPEMFSSAEIFSGTTTAKRSAGGIGGSVSFRTKSASDYLRNDKTTYFGAKTAYDSADRSWNESFTAAGRKDDLDGLIAYSHRDGHETRNNSDVANSEPETWHSNALLLKGGLRVDGANRLELSADLYRRKNNTAFSGWDTNNAYVTSRSLQDSDTSRNTLQASHLWTPSGIALLDQLDTRLFFQDTATKDVTDTMPLTAAGGTASHDISENKTRSWGFSTTADKRFDNHHLSYGLNASTQDVDRPWNVEGYMKPQPDTTVDRYGVFIEDEISFLAGGRRLAVIPALRADRVELKPRDLGNFISGVL
ncbi:MAG TPA: TonB-dependent receptor plug domain-containing protein, partial [Burkholderiaceae bacterium]